MRVDVKGDEVTITVKGGEFLPNIIFCWEMVCTLCGRQYRVFRTPRTDRKNHCGLNCARNTATKIYRDKKKKQRRSA